ncbi:MAG: hypothetical protein ACI9IV_001078 [Paracoccaceae bacterium]|jgi:hypothetical protein
MVWQALVLCPLTTNTRAPRSPVQCDGIAFELVCELQSGHPVVLASQITKQGVLGATLVQGLQRMAAPLNGANSTTIHCNHVSQSLPSLPADSKLGHAHRSLKTYFQDRIKHATPLVFKTEASRGGFRAPSFQPFPRLSCLFHRFGRRASRHTVADQSAQPPRRSGPAGHALRHWAA